MRASARMHPATARLNGSCGELRPCPAASGSSSRLVLTRLEHVLAAHDLVEGIRERRRKGGEIHVRLVEARSAAVLIGFLQGFVQACLQSRVSCELPKDASASARGWSSASFASDAPADSPIRAYAAGARSERYSNLSYCALPTSSISSARFAASISPRRPARSNAACSQAQV